MKTCERYWECERFVAWRKSVESTTGNTFLKSTDKKIVTLMAKSTQGDIAG